MGRDTDMNHPQRAYRETKKHRPYLEVPEKAWMSEEAHPTLIVSFFRMF